MVNPILIDMPDPPSAPDTPTEAPGTPNSTTTSLSALSTTAIKDGHRGSSFPHTGLGHHHTPSSNTLEAERADRISRLAGLERVSTARPSSANVPGNAVPGANAGQIPGYFDAAGNPVYTTKMSTVGSASATGSVGGRTTTWASGSARGDDEMSMDTNPRDMDDRDRMSTSAVDEDDGMSDDTSLVGFGEGAGSTMSGPTYSRSNLLRSGLGSQLSSNPGTPIDRATGRDVRSADGSTDEGSRASAVETAERIVRDRLDEGEARQPPLGAPENEAELGNFISKRRRSDG